jgi:hypothetical protein
MAAFHGARLVAMVVQWHVPLRVRGRSTAGRTAGDVAVHPAYRGLGLWNRVRVLPVEAPGSELFYGFTLNPIVRGSATRRNPQAFGKDVHVLQKRLPRHRFRRPRLITGAVRLRSPAAAAVQVEEVGRFDERVDALFEECAPEFDFIIERRQEWLNWRYADPRGGRSSLRLATDGDGRLLGYAVLRTQRFWSKPDVDVAGRRQPYLERGIIADLLVLPGRDDTLHVLCQDAAAFFQARGLATATLWTGPGHPYRDTCIDEGFAYTGDEIEFRLRPADPDHPDYRSLATEGSRIHLQPGDTDHV